MTLWGGRFEEPPAAEAWEFTVDDNDRRLLVDDITGSLAHVAMLAEVGILTPEERDTLADGLRRVLSEAEAGAFAFQPGDEDVHTAVERRLGELIGPLAGKLHTGRSRNDQIALDIRLYLRRAARNRIRDILGLVAALADQAEANVDTVVATYTHLQQAQAVSLGHHLLAHAWALTRDAERFRDLRNRLDESPLGAGASAGSSLPLDPEATAEALGFRSVFENSMDAVGSRDLVAEYAYCCAQAMVTISRLAEELVLWATREFGWATFADRHTTGSSALPHKKNPDIAELARGKAASVIGDVTALLAVQKGLPLTYNRDLQEDKRAVFHADDVLAGATRAVAAMVIGADFHPPAPDPWVTALDVAERLVARGVPFREAHAVVGRLVAHLLDQGRTLAEATPEDVAAVGGGLEADDLAATDPTVSVAARRTHGAGSPADVVRQLAELRGRVEAFEASSARP